MNFTRTAIADRPAVSSRETRNSSSRNRRFDVCTMCSGGSSSFGGREKTHVFDPARYHTPAGLKSASAGAFDASLASATNTSARWLG